MTVYNSIVRKPTDGSTRVFTFSFAGGYVSRDYVKVRFTDAAGVESDVPLAASNWTGPYQLTFATAFSAGGVLMIYRDTPKDTPIVDFADGSIINEKNLDSGFDQAIHAVAELWDRAADVDTRVDELITQANEATGMAQVAYDRATDAQLRAAEAQQHANDALAGVAGAEQAAIAATAAAQQAAAAAIDATDAVLRVESKADDAVATANAASSVANGIAGTANDAFLAAEAAEAAASNAELVAGAVDGKATTALSNSATAMGTANDALEAAGKNAEPVGSVGWWPYRPAIPAGRIPGDGQIISRSLYPNLTEAVLTGALPVVTDAEFLADPALRGSYTTGDGSTTIRVPDYNGKLPDSFGAVFLRGDGKLAATASGMIQNHALQDHTHDVSIGATTGGSGTRRGYAPFGTGSAPTYGTENTLGANVAAETRPIAVTGCVTIRAFGAVINAGDLDAAQLASDLAALTARVAAIENAPVDHGQCRLVVVSGAEIRLYPYNGDGLLIDGEQFRIPYEGVPLSNVGMGANRHLFVWAKKSASGGIELEWSPWTAAGGHEQGHRGVRIKGGDPTRTLIGMIGTNGGGLFQDDAGSNMLLANWFNRRPRAISESISGTLHSQPSDVGLGNGRQFLCWGDCDTQSSMSGYGNLSGAGNYYSMNVRRNGGVFSGEMAATAGANGGPASGSSIVSGPVPEGRHVAQVFGRVSAGTVACAFRMTVILMI